MPTDPACEQRGEVVAAEHEHCRRLGRLHGHRVLSALEQPDLADDVAWPGPADLDHAVAGHLKRRQTPPSTMKTSSRA